MGILFLMTPWQNAAWIFDISYEKEIKLWERLDKLRADFSQDSIAWMTGTTQFIKESLT